MRKDIHYIGMYNVQLYMHSGNTIAQYSLTVLRRTARKREIKIKIKRVGRRKGEKMGVRQRKGEGGRKKRNW